jgi:hypothetical protein
MENRQFGSTSSLSSATGCRATGNLWNDIVAERENMTENTNAHLPRNLEQAKKRAYAIKDRLNDLGHSVGLSHVFEALALACGMRNWNTFQNALKSAAEWDDGNDAVAPKTPP